MGRGPKVWKLHLKFTSTEDAGALEERVRTLMESEALTDKKWNWRASLEVPSSTSDGTNTRTFNG